MKVVFADLSKTDEYERFGKNIAGIDTGVLVNNVGVSPKPNLLLLIDEMKV